jgi:phospholipase C
MQKTAAVNPLSRIENIVVLLLENRSFDNILGALHPNSAAFEGLKLDGSMYNTHKLTNYPVTNQASGNPFTTPSPDPGESFVDINLQIFNSTASSQTASMGGFVNDWLATPDDYPDIPTGKNCLFAPSWPALPRNPSLDPSDIMFYFTTAGPSPQLPVTSALAQNFAVSDAWFGSCPTQTFPNRFFACCATSGGYVDDVDYLCHLEIFPRLPCIFELLDGGNPQPSDWKIYYHDFPLAPLIDYVFHADLSAQGMMCNFDRSDYGGSSVTPTFLDDIGNQTLPRVSWIEPRYSPNLVCNLTPNSNHPPYNVGCGETLLADIYNAIRSSSYYWPRTLLIVTYDEHGGCFDHVIPPPAVPPGAGSTILPRASAFPFNRFGPRVPALFVSPYIAAGSIIRPAGFAYTCAGGVTNGVTPFDHTSIIKTIVECFGITAAGGESPASLTDRDRNAPSLSGAITLDGSNMNNGPDSIEPPAIENTGEARELPPSHLAEIYQSMMLKSENATRLGLNSRRNIQMM